MRQRGCPRELAGRSRKQARFVLRAKGTVQGDFPHNITIRARPTTIFFLGQHSQPECCRRPSTSKNLLISCSFFVITTPSPRASAPLDFLEALGSAADSVLEALPLSDLVVVGEEDVEHDLRTLFDEQRDVLESPFFRSTLRETVKGGLRLLVAAFEEHVRENGTTIVEVEAAGGTDVEEGGEGVVGSSQERTNLDVLDVASVLGSGRSIPFLCQQAEQVFLTRDNLFAREFRDSEQVRQFCEMVAEHR